MTVNHFDLIVVGLGAMGAAALYQASKRGATALGIDRFDPPHTFGSSHGDTRITRQAMGEGEIYMPFVRRSNEIWRELELKSGRELFHQSGGLVIGPRDNPALFHARGDFVRSSARMAQKYDIPHEVLGATEVNERFPLLMLGPQDHAYYEPGGGVLRPELCIQSQLELALGDGATIQTQETVTGYEPSADGLRLLTDKRSYHADTVILSAGAWVLDLLPPEYRQGFKVYRQVIYWFEAEDISKFYPENFPFLIWIGDQLDDFFSAFPALRDGRAGVKIMTEQYREATHPNSIDRVVHPQETARMYHELTVPRLKGLREKLIHADVCMYTVTPDEHFVIDRHPASERVIIASPCSGHGFKHSAAVGETLVQLALDGQTQFDISHFNLARLTV